MNGQLGRDPRETQSCFSANVTETWKVRPDPLRGPQQLPRRTCPWCRHLRGQGHREDWLGQCVCVQRLHIVNDWTAHKHEVTVLAVMTAAV